MIHMPKPEFCTCPLLECPDHANNHDGNCTPCIKKNLEHHEVPACFWSKIGDTKNAKSEYTFKCFARKVVEVEDDGGN